MLELTDIGISELSLIILFFNVILLIKTLKIAPELKWFFFLQVWALLIQIIASEYGKRYGNNLPLLHLYTLFEFIFLSLFYWRILISKLENRRFFSYFVGIVIMLIVGNSIFLNPISSFNTNAKGLTQVIIMAYAITYFFNRISIEVKTGNMVLNRTNAAVLLYYAGSLFVFTFAQYVIERSEKAHHIFWTFNSVLYLVFQLLIFFTIWRLVFVKKKHIFND